MSAAAPVLLFGRGGQVGRELLAALRDVGRVVALDLPDVDFLDPASLRAAVRAARPLAIVNAAAYTDVDRAEDEEETAAAVNARAPRVLAEEAEALGVPIVHYSTDYVFDGTAREAYTEDDAPRPLNAYGRTKLAGDTAVLAACRAALVLRSSWIYAPRGRNFYLAIRRLAAEGRPLRVVDDQAGCPTPARLVAQTTAELLRQCWTGRDFGRAAEVAGLYNAACAGCTTWYGFARAFVPPHIPIAAIRTAELARKAARPPLSALDCSRLARVFGIRLPRWETALAEVQRLEGAGADGTDDGAGSGEGTGTTAEYGVALGSNLGDRFAALSAAREQVARLPGVAVRSSSPVYETEPVDAPPGAGHLPFLNAVLIVATARAPGDLLGALLDIEARLGRTRSGVRNEPRTLDIDLLYCSAGPVRTGALTLPHPRLPERRFVLQPLGDLRPGLRLEPSRLPVRDALLALPPRPAVVRYRRSW